MKGDRLTLAERPRALRSWLLLPKLKAAEAMAVCAAYVTDVCDSIKLLTFFSEVHFFGCLLCWSALSAGPPQ